MHYGLSEYAVEKITNILKTFPEIDQAIIYGSRAKGNYREGSDIDFTFKGNLSYNDLSKLYGIFDDSDLPYTFDLSIYRQLNNNELIEHIDRVGILFYQK